MAHPAARGSIDTETRGTMDAGSGRRGCVDHGADISPVMGPQAVEQWLALRNVVLARAEGGDLQAFDDASLDLVRAADSLP